MNNLTKTLQSLEAEKARLTEANSWKDLPKNIRYALQKRMEDVKWSIGNIKERLKE